MASIDVVVVGVVDGAGAVVVMMMDGMVFFL